MRRTFLATTGVLALGAGLIVPTTALAADAGRSLAAVDAGKRTGVKLTLKGPKADPVAGDAVTVKGKATVKKQPVAKAKVKLLRKKGSKWVAVGKTTTNKKGKYRKSVALPNKRTVDVRATLVKPTRVKGTGSSTLTVTFTQPAKAPAPSSPVPTQTSSPASTDTSTPTPSKTILVDCNSDTVSGAVAAASAGDTLNITGTCKEAGIIIDKNLTLTGDGTIDATGLNDRVLTNNRGIDLAITGDLTITGGNAPAQDVKLGCSTEMTEAGGGIFNNRGTVTLDNATITGNEATDYGGGIFNHGGWVTLNGGTISGNTAKYGGGIGNSIIYNMGGTGAVVTLNGGTITGNIADSVGGGISSSGTVNLNGGTITGNTANGNGGGISQNHHGTVNLNSGTITNNTADKRGGGIVSWGGTVTMNAGTITGNTAADGGGIYNRHGGTVNLTGGTITSNEATNNGGGIWNYRGTSSSVIATVNLDGGTITGNTAADGGGIYNGGARVNLNSGTITSNTATDGGGIYNTTDMDNNDNGTVNGDTSLVTGNDPDNIVG